MLINSMTDNLLIMLNVTRMLKTYLTNSLLCLIIVQILAPSTLLANSCFNLGDTFSNYDNRVKRKDIYDIESDYYVLSYTWAPSFCTTVKEKSKHPGGRNFLQCHDGASFGYILHGLWPQGSSLTKGRYPRACKGSQLKVAREVLEPFLCMTPSVWLLQHAYEYHGTCMPQGELQTAEGYFNQAKALHEQLFLPKKALSNTTESVRWWHKNNQHLVKGAIKYSSNNKEWQFCYDSQFNSMSCPNFTTQANGNVNQTSRTVRKSLVGSGQCLIKGNISKNSNKRLYFMPDHTNYSAVVINFVKGERCFINEKEAKQAGWVKAR